MQSLAGEILLMEVVGRPQSSTVNMLMMEMQSQPQKLLVLMVKIVHLLSGWMVMVLEELKRTLVKSGLTTNV